MKWKWFGGLVGPSLFLGAKRFMRSSRGACYSTSHHVVPYYCESIGELAIEQALGEQDFMIEDFAIRMGEIDNTGVLIP